MQSYLEVAMKSDKREANNFLGFFKGDHTPILIQNLITFSCQLCF